MSTNDEAKHSPATSAATTKGDRSFSINYQQDREIGWYYQQTFPIPDGHQFIIEYLTMSCRDPVKEATISCTLSSAGSEQRFDFQPAGDSSLPYGVFRIDQRVEIPARGSVTITVEDVNPKPGVDMGIGDLIIKATGHLTRI